MYKIFECVHFWVMHHVSLLVQKIVPSSPYSGTETNREAKIAEKRKIPISHAKLKPVSTNFFCQGNYRHVEYVGVWCSMVCVAG